ncbi:MAG TPA: T9SS type A sorting domain-containing protein [Phnomibacter sp.]|nr:T9SS type A sorting domain-containing protein [Phnomibacter sp.]
MKKVLPICVLTLLAAPAIAQSGKALFAVTGNQPGSIQWTSIRQQSDNQELLDATKPTYFISARTNKKITPTLKGGGQDATVASMGIAALAYDAASNRLYFSPLFRDGGIRYIDLDNGGNQKVVSVYDDVYNLLDRAKDGEGRNITRMVIGKNNLGYAISNDGNSFIRFSTRGNVQMENLGSLVDDESNGQVSVHAFCNSWGGDIVAAENGDLYLFTMRQLVFKINPATRVTTYLGTLQGPDAQFAVNGAAVDEEGRVVLCSSIEPGTRWIIDDMKTLKARSEKNAQWFNASDLASANLLFASKASAPVAKPVADIVFRNGVGVYPNPVTNGRFSVIFQSLPAGRYTLDMVNGLGVSHNAKTVEVKEKGQMAQFETGNLPKGLYIFRITNASRKESFTEKMIVQ